MKLLPLTLLLGVVAVCSAYGQEIPPTQPQEPPPLLIRPTVGFSFGVDVAEVPVYNGGSLACGAFTGGRTFASNLGGTIALPSFLTSDLGFIASLRFSFSSGRLTTQPLVPIRVPDPETEQLVDVSEEYRLSTVSIATTLELLAWLKLSDRFTLGFGPFLGFRLSPTFTQTENVLAPEDYVLENGHKEQPMIDGPAVSGNPFTFGPSLQARYAFPFGSHRYLVPGISIQADLLSSIREYSWRSYRAGLSVSLLFDIASPPEPIDTVPDVPTVVPQTPHLAASVAMHGVDEENNPLPTARIQVFETIFQRHAPLLPAVFFEKNEDVLPERYSVLDYEGARSFSTDILAELNALEIQHDMLNVVGTRLREKTESALVLAGTVSKDEPANLAARRTRRVRSYLTEIWEIDTSRVRVGDGMTLMQRSNEETEDGRGDNRRVEMASDDLSILAPVVTTQVIRDFDPPLIRMRPEWDAEAGVKEWTLVISQGGNEVARYGSRQDEPDSNDITWRIVHDRVDSALSPLVATLTVEDSTGATVTAESSLPLTMVRNPRIVNQRIERTGNHERLAYTLVGFDFSSAGLGAQNSRVVREIADVVKDGADVKVMGYTDRIGDQERNRELATERAINVAKVLQRLLEEKEVDEVVINVSGEGAEAELFDNNLPEGRVLSRGVGIVVDQISEEEEP